MVVINFRTPLGYIACEVSRGFRESLEFGEKISKTWTIVANYNLFNKVFNEGDLLFLDGAKPTNIELYEKEANAVITSVRYQNKIIRIIAEKKDLQGGEDYGN